MTKDASLIQGLHHITLVTSNQEVNRRFYTEILGLKRVKLSVNQDDIYHRHLFYADDPAKGNAITFFEWPDLPRGMIGLGSPHHLSYEVPSVDQLSKWRGWLSHNRVPSKGLYSRGGRVSLYLRDPDGVIIEITARDEEGVSQGYLQETKSPLVKQLSADMKLSSFNHASPITRDPETISRFMDKAFGLKATPLTPNPDERGSSTLGVGNDDRTDFLRYLSGKDAPRGYVGIGNIHHIAMAVESDEEQLNVLKTLDRIGISNSGIIDRFWFHSLYFRDPDGNLLEVATKNPGYTVDEPKATLGSKLVLPSWLEPRRSEIQGVLDAADEANPVAWPPPVYPSVPQPPEKLSVEIA
jgi:glyoxalase family protein